LKVETKKEIDVTDAVAVLDRLDFLKLKMGWNILPAHCTADYKI